MSFQKHEWVQFARDLKQHLQDHYPSSSWLMTDRENWMSFRQMAQMAQKAPPTASPSPAPKVASSPSPAKKTAPLSLAPRKRRLFSQSKRQASPSPQPSAPRAPREKRKPLQEAKGITAQEAQRILQPVLGKTPFISSIPCDQAAREKAHRWKSRQEKLEVLLLHDSQNTSHRNFLSKVSFALDQNLGPCQLCDLNELSTPESLDLSTVKLVITPKKLLERYNSWQERLDPKLTYTLEPLQSYIETPSLKRTLWSALKERLGSHS